MSMNSVLPAVWNVPEQIRARLGEQAGRQRAMSADGHLVIVLHAPPGPEDDQRVGRYFWRNPEGQWSSDAFGGGPNALNRHLQEYGRRLDELEQQDLEASSAREYFVVLAQLTPIQRASRNMHQALQQAREMCPEDRLLINCRDRAYEIERRAELLQADVKSTLDLAIAIRAEEQAEAGRRMSQAAHRLNILAAFFFPIATLSAVFGVNLTHGFEQEYAPYAFFAVLGVGLLLGFVITAFITLDRETKRQAVVVDTPPASSSAGRSRSAEPSLRAQRASLPTPPGTGSV